MALGRRAGTGFPGERSGTLPATGNLSQIETATLSYGYGFSVTALQLAQAYAVLAANGLKQPVSLLKLTPQQLANLPRQQVIDPVVAARLRAMLEAVVDPALGGSADEAGVPRYRVAGKTGTAHVVGASGYDKNLHNSLFAGIAPARDPRVVIVVIINEPKGDQRYGGQVAAPVFARVTSGIMRLLNVPPDPEPETDLVTLSNNDEPATVTD